jgi:hypothetical protein
MGSEHGSGKSKWRGAVAALAAMALGTGLALAASAFGSPSGGAKFGVYTALEQHGSEQLQVILSVEDPVTKLAFTAQCARLESNKNIVDVYNSPAIALHNESFSFHRRVKISKITETKTMALIGKSSYRSEMQVSGHFAHNKATGSAMVGGSGCSPGYTAKRKPGPTLTGPT